MLVKCQYCDDDGHLFLPGGVTSEIECPSCLGMANIEEADVVVTERKSFIEWAFKDATGWSAAVVYVTAAVVLFTLLYLVGATLARVEPWFLLGGSILGVAYGLIRAYDQYLGGE